ncbi:hypothetical protein [Filibacter tadaridae]
MLTQNNEPVAKISKEEDITEVMLQKCFKDACTTGLATPGDGQTSNN